MSVKIERVHSSQLDKFSWGAIDLTEGRAKGTYITMAFNNPRTNSQSDAGGSSRSTSLMGDRSGTLTLTLMKQSPANAALMSSFEKDDENGTVTFADFYIQTGNTLYLYQPKGCHISQAPEDTTGEDVSDTTNDWVFDVAEMSKIPLAERGLTIELEARIAGQVDITISNTIPL